MALCNHKCSFRNKSREKNTGLCKYLRELKERDINCFINWDIARNTFVDLESVTYVFLKSSLLQEQILMFFSIDVMRLSQNAGVEMNLLRSASKVGKMIYAIWCM